MGDVVNLNRARKDRDSADRKVRAERNRAAHGRSKAERDKAKAEADRAARDLEGHHRDRGDRDGKE